MSRYLRVGVLICGFIILLTAQSVSAAVVFSNFPSTNDPGELIANGQEVVVIFDVPAGSDYTVNSVSVVLENADGANPITVSARLHSDGVTAPGAVVVDLGTNVVAAASMGTHTFNPAGSAILPGGARYWLVLGRAAGPALNAQWMSTGTTAPTGTFTFVNNGPFTGGAFFAQAARFSVSIDADPVAGPTGGGGGLCAGTDGRVNDVCAYPGQTAAIYCRADGSIDIYGITNSAGWLAFRVTQAEIDDLGVPEENTLLEASADGAIRLFRLASGEFQVNSPVWDVIRGNLPDGYTFRWPGC